MACIGRASTVSLAQQFSNLSPYLSSLQLCLSNDTLGCFPVPQTPHPPNTHITSTYKHLQVVYALESYF